MTEFLHEKIAKYLESQKQTLGSVERSVYTYSKFSSNPQKFQFVSLNFASEFYDGQTKCRVRCRLDCSHNVVVPNRFAGPAVDKLPIDENDMIAFSKSFEFSTIKRYSPARSIFKRNILPGGGYTTIGSRFGVTRRLRNFTSQ